MKRITIAATLTIVSVVFSGYASATVVHPEDPNIVGRVFSNFPESDTVCFNNDGDVISADDCLGSYHWTEGVLELLGGFWQGAESGIRGCGGAPVDPVISATCPTETGAFETCTPGGYVLVKTTKSGHFWAVKANENCELIAEPESTGLVPCLLTDTFDVVTGCTTPNPDPPEITVDEGYIKLDTHEGNPPPFAHCTDPSHDGRMVVDSVNDLLYICTQSGWIAK